MNPIFYYSLSSMCFICVIIIHGSINIRGGLSTNHFLKFKMTIAASLFIQSLYGFYSKNEDKAKSYTAKRESLPILFPKKQQKTFLPWKIYL